MKILTCLLLAGVIATGFVRLASAETVATTAELLPAYVKIADALAADDLAAAQSSAAALAEHAGMADQARIAEQATAVAKAKDLPSARDAFKALSASIEPLAVDKKGFTTMTCPMVKADWVQATGPVKNPYFGRSMLTCGGPKKSGAVPEHGCGDSDKGCKDM